MTDIAGKVVLITGGTGSFGTRVSAHMMTLHPREIRILSRDETKQWDMKRKFPDFRYFIGDVRDERTIEDAIRGVDYVFHAAAMKQVPTCEMFPWEALKTNSIGAFNVCRAAEAAGVRVVVGLSTDKAVKPVNAMGISKALMEKLVCSQNEFGGDTVFCCVRYGNVMGSRGSIIPLFRALIKAGEPLTLTVPGMTRFIMTLDESVDLVVHAMKTAKGGEVFVRKAPASTVLDLARAIARKYSRLGEGHPIVEIGMRPGEKLHEVLVNEYEMQRASEDDTYFTIHSEYAVPKNLGPRPPGVEYTSENTRRLTTYEQLAAMLDAMGETESYV